ncbi:MAG: InlB B-repeat-containing protein [Alphaproteobacteria bacterium]|nr:InlB B-repeat-containing protein [Alphaproteobacteria bacterium]
MVCVCHGVSHADDTVGTIDLTNLPLWQSSVVNSSVSSAGTGINTDYSFDNSSLLASSIINNGIVDFDSGLTPSGNFIDWSRWGLTPISIGGDDSTGDDTGNGTPTTGTVVVGWLCPGASGAILNNLNAGSTLLFPQIKTQCPGVGTSDQRDMWFCLINDGTSVVGFGVVQGSNITVPAGRGVIACTPANIVKWIWSSASTMSYAQCGADITVSEDNDVWNFLVTKQPGGWYYWDGSMTNPAVATRQQFRQMLELTNLYVNMKNGEASGAYRVGPTQDLSKLDDYYTKTTTTTYVDVGVKLTLRCPNKTSAGYLLPIGLNLNESQLNKVYRHCGDTYNSNNSKIMCKTTENGTSEELTTSTEVCVIRETSSATTEVTSGTTTSAVVCNEFDCELTQCWSDLNCEEGFYLPYGKAECEPCPQGYYCSGYKNGDQNWCYADSGSNTFGNGTIGGHGIESCVAVMGDSTATTDAKANPAGEPDNGCNVDCGAKIYKCCASKPTACYIPCKGIESDDNNTLVPKEEKVFYKADADNKCKYSVTFAYKKEGEESENGCNVTSCCEDYPSYADVYGIESLMGAKTVGFMNAVTTVARDHYINGRAGNSSNFALGLSRTVAQIGGRGTNSKSDYLSLCTPNESDNVCGAGKEFQGWELYSIYNVPNKQKNAVALKPKCKPKTYNITYKLDGGEWPDGSPTKNTYTFGENFKDNKPTKRGYVFKGWKKDNDADVCDEECGCKLYDTEAVWWCNVDKNNNAIAGVLGDDWTGDVTLTAVWEPIKYGYIYKHMGTVGATGRFDNTQTTTYGGGAKLAKTSDAISLEHWNVTGYTFTHWCRAKNVLTGSIRECQEYEGNSYAADGTVPVDNLLTEEELNGGKDLGTTTGSSELIYIGPIWKAIDYTIHYDFGVGTCSGTDCPTTYNIKSETITISALSKDGYEFKGWCSYNKADNDGANCSDENEPSQTVEISTGSTGDRWLYAVWKPITYYICYKDGQDVQDETACTCSVENAGTCGDYTKTDYSDYKYTYTIEDTFTLPVPPRPASENDKDWGFVGWYNGKNKINKISKQFGNLTLYAHWTKQLATVNFVCSYAKIVTVKDKQIGETIAYPTESPCDEVENWSCGGGDFDVVQDNGGIIVKSDKTVTCRSAYKIKYMNPDGNTNTEIKVNGQTLTPRSYTGLGTTYFPDYTTMNNLNIRPGYSFAGWFLNTNFTNEVTRLAPRASGKKILYANWTPIKYTIKFDKNGGTGDSMAPMTNITVETDSLKLTKNTYTKTGYYFDGWCLERTCDTAWATDEEEIKDLDLNPQQTTITLYAKWEPITYTIGVKKCGTFPGVPSQSDITAEYGDGTTLPDNPFSKTGYDFDGWCLADDGTGANHKCIEPVQSFEENALADSLIDLGNLPDGDITINICPIWTPKTIKCDPGYYLPLYKDGAEHSEEVNNEDRNEECAPCEDGYWCPGLEHEWGTYVDGTDYADLYMGRNDCDRTQNTSWHSDSPRSEHENCWYSYYGYCSYFFPCPSNATCEWNPSMTGTKKYYGSDAWIDVGNNNSTGPRQCVPPTVTCDDGYELNTETQQCNKKYTVSYKHCGYATSTGAGVLGSVNTSVGSGTTLKSTQDAMNVWSRTGYTFTNWCRAEDNVTNGKRKCRSGDDSVSAVAGTGLTDYLLTESDSDTANLTIIVCPIWKPIDYTIHYYDSKNEDLIYDDYLWSESETYSITSESPIDLDTPESQTGYTFTGWCLYDEQQLDIETASNCESVIDKLSVSAENLGDKYLYAKWTPKTIVCDPGYYLPANSEEQAECPADNYCSGGTYTYTGAAQGATSCPDDYPHSDGGTDATDKTSCYKDCPDIEHKQLIGGKISYVSDTESNDTCEYEFYCESGKYFHIGDGKVCLYKTKPVDKPVLGIKIKNKSYYIMLSDTGNKTISKGSSKKLRVKIGPKIYNAHDASVLE